MSVPSNQMALPGATDPTLASISGMADPMQQQLQSDTQALEGLNKDVSSMPQFEEKPPVRGGEGLMKSMPFLIGLATVGGKAAGLHAQTMLGGMNGMVRGMMQGSDKAYQEAQKKYDDSYQRYIDRHKAMLQVYNEMRQVYKGRVDADLRALEIARKAVGDDAKMDQNAVKNWQWEQQYAVKLEEEQRKRMEAEARVRQMEASTGKTTAQTDVIKGGGAKGKEHAQHINDANTLIDEIIALSGKKTNVLGAKMSPTGFGGKVARTAETIGNVTGVSNQTGAHDFESKLSDLQLLLPKLLTGSSKSAKDERAKVETIARGLKAGDTPQNTKSALLQLKKAIGALPAEEEGKTVVRSGTLNGRKVVQYSDGSTAYAD